jgi:L-arabinose transport system substrate-binding protein
MFRLFPDLTRLSLSIGMVAMVAMGPSACGGGPTSSDQHPKFAVIIRSQGGSIYFQKVGEGAKAEAKKLGAEITIQFTESTDQQLSAVDSVIAAGAKGIIITIQDPSIGPAIAAKAKAANVPLLASDDVFKDGAGNPVPVVTIDAKGFGKQVGAEMAKQFKAAGWDPSQVGIASIELPKLQTCVDRTDGAWQAFSQQVAGFPSANVYHIDYDGSLNNALTVMSAAINNHRSVKYWLSWSCNDEGVAGALKALSNSGVAVTNVIGVGLGGELACDHWNSKAATAFKATIALDPVLNGQVDVDVLYDKVVKGKAMPLETDFPGLLATPDNYAFVRNAYAC